MQEANAQTRNETAKVLREQKDAILKNNPALTILAPLKMLAEGAKEDGVKSVTGTKKINAKTSDYKKHFLMVSIQ